MNIANEKKNTPNLDSARSAVCKNIDKHVVGLYRSVKTGLMVMDMAAHCDGGSIDTKLLLSMPNGEGGNPNAVPEEMRDLTIAVASGPENAEKLRVFMAQLLSDAEVKATEAGEQCHTHRGSTKPPEEKKDAN